MNNIHKYLEFTLTEEEITTETTWTSPFMDSITINT